MQQGYGYQVYKKVPDGDVFETTGFLNWFSNKDEAIECCKSLINTWGELGYEYIIVKKKIGTNMFE